MRGEMPAPPQVKFFEENLWEAGKRTPQRLVRLGAKNYWKRTEGDTFFLNHSHADGRKRRNGTTDPGGRKIHRWAESKKRGGGNPSRGGEKTGARRDGETKKEH